MDNRKEWFTFLSPLYCRHPTRNKAKYDITTIDPKPSMSRDIALKLEQEVTVDQDDLNEYKRSLQLQEQRERTKRTLFSPRTTQSSEETITVDEDADDKEVQWGNEKQIMSTKLTVKDESFPREDKPVKQEILVDSEVISDTNPLSPAGHQNITDQYSQQEPCGDQRLQRKTSPGFSGSGDMNIISPTRQPVGSPVCIEENSDDKEVQWGNEKQIMSTKLTVREESFPREDKPVKQEILVDSEVISDTNPLSPAGHQNITDQYSQQEPYGDQRLQRKTSPGFSTPHSVPSPVCIEENSDAGMGDDAVNENEEEVVPIKRKLDRYNFDDDMRSEKLQKLSDDEEKSKVEGKLVKNDNVFDSEPNLLKSKTYPQVFPSKTSIPPTSGQLDIRRPIPTNKTHLPSTIRSSVTMSSTELPSGYHGPVQSTTPKARPMVRPTKQVDHRATSLSKWTFEMFTNYVEFKKYVRVLKISEKPDFDLEQLHGYINTLYEDVLTMFGAKSLKNCMFRESDIRVLLNGLLLKLCKLHDVRLQTEEQSKLQYLPTGKFDYLFRTKDGRPLGCVEAKSPGNMDKKAFAQAVLELNLVQQLAHKNGVDTNLTPLFCILSDGYRFILMQLKGSELLLEHTTDITEVQKRMSPGNYFDGSTKASCVSKIKIRQLDGEEDFRILVSIISSMIEMSKSALENTFVKKDSKILDYIVLD